MNLIKMIVLATFLHWVIFWSVAIVLKNKNDCSEWLKHQLDGFGVLRFGMGSIVWIVE